MLAILSIWLGINLVLLVILLHRMVNSVEPLDLLVFPKLHEFFEDHEVEGVGIYFFDILFVLVTWPALLVYYTLFLSILILCLILESIYNLVKLIKRRRK